MKHLKLLKIQNMMYIKGVLLQWFMNFFLKSSDRAIKNEIMPIKDLAKELHKPVITKFWKRKVYSSFIDDIRGMHLISKQVNFNKGIRILLYVIDIIGKDAWVIFLWKIKKAL